MDKGGGGGGTASPGENLTEVAATPTTPNTLPKSKTSTFGGTPSSQGSLQSSAPPSRGGGGETRTPRAQKTPRNTERHQGQGRESPYA
jgi:hypothetical protein